MSRKQLFKGIPLPSRIGRHFFTFYIRIFCVYCNEFNGHHDSDLPDRTLFSPKFTIIFKSPKVYKVRKFKDFYDFSLCSKTTASTVVPLSNRITIINQLRFPATDYSKDIICLSASTYAFTPKGMIHRGVACPIFILQRTGNA